MREYAVSWTDPVGVTRQLGRVTARVAYAAAHAAYQARPFLPVGSLSLVALSPTPEPVRRGFHDSDTARRAARDAHAPAAEAKRRATRAARAQATPQVTLTLGQRKWRDLMRRRKRTSPRHASHDGG